MEWTNLGPEPRNRSSLPAGLGGPVDLRLVDPVLATKVEDLILRCRRRGFEMRPYTGLRDCREQARLWRQSRSIEEIERAVVRLKRRGANYLAKCLVEVGPQNGRRVTNDLPGLSWHQWGEAVDAFWLLDGSAEWSTRKSVGGANAYRVWAQEAENLGLVAGGHRSRHADWPHVQISRDSTPAVSRSYEEIDAVMAERFA